MDVLLVDDVASELDDDNDEIELDDEKATEELLAELTELTGEALDSEWDVSDRLDELDPLDRLGELVDVELRLVELRLDRLLDDLLDVLWVLGLLID